MQPPEQSPSRNQMDALQSQGVIDWRYKNRFCDIFTQAMILACSLFRQEKEPGCAKALSVVAEDTAKLAAMVAACPAEAQLAARCMEQHIEDPGIHRTTACSMLRSMLARERGNELLAEMPEEP